MFTTLKCWETATSSSQTSSPSTEACTCAEPPLLERATTPSLQLTSLCWVRQAFISFQICWGQYIPHCCSFPVAPPSLVEWPESLTRPRAGTARFVCQAEGVPTPQITWLKNGEKVHSNGRIKMYNRYLQHWRFVE